MGRKLFLPLIQPFQIFPLPSYTMEQASQRHDFSLGEEERTLVQQCLQQDRKAQRQLYDRYKDAMYTLSYRITNDFDLAQDVLQEGFLAVFRWTSQLQRGINPGSLDQNDHRSDGLQKAQEKVPYRAA